PSLYASRRRGPRPAGARRTRRRGRPHPKGCGQAPTARAPGRGPRERRSVARPHDRSGGRRGGRALGLRHRSRDRGESAETFGRLGFFESFERAESAELAGGAFVTTCATRCAPRYTAFLPCSPRRRNAILAVVPLNLEEAREYEGG